MKRAALLVLGLAVGLAGCDMIPSTSEPDPISDIEITPSLVRFDALGASTSFEAIVLTETGVEVPETDISWSSSNPSVATVNSAGVVTAAGNGEATIEATAEGITSEATVVVEQVVHTVTIGADSMRLNYVGATATVQAQARDSRGNAVPGATLTWHSTAPDTVSVSASGQLTGLRVGTALVVATAANGEADTIRVRVRQVAASVTVQPSQDTIQVGQTTQLSAVVRDSGNAIVSGAPVSWSSNASGTASVSSAGLVTGVAAGTATITATSGAATGTSSILVQLTPLGSVRLNPDSAVVAIDSTQLFRVTLRDLAGNIVSPAGRSITWTSTAPGVATVTGTADSAVVTGVAVGTTDIIVSSGGRADTARVRVVVPCAAGTISIGQVLGGALATTDCQSGGRYLDRWSITIAVDTVLRFDLSSSAFDPMLTLLSSSGTVLEHDDDDGPGTSARIERRLAPGTYTLEATSAATGATGSYTIAARFIPVASVVVKPDSAVIGVGNTVAFGATLLSATAGDTISPAGRTFMWTSTAPSIASVVGSGDSAVVTGQAAGTASIIVSSGGRADTARVRVTAACGGGSITIGQTYVDSTLATTDCSVGGKYYDTWTLTIASDTVVWLDMTSTAFDPYLELYNSAGTALIEADDNDGTGTDAHIERALAAGTYRLRVTSTGTGATGSYTLSVTGSTGQTTIEQARQRTSGVVTVEGTITAGTGVFNSVTFYVQDTTAGILVFLDPAATWTEGTRVRVTGTRSAFNQEQQISAYRVISVGTATVPAPRTVQSTDVNAGSYQGELVVARNAIVDSVESGSFNYEVWVTDASGSFTVFIDGDVGIPDTSWHVGSRYDVTGMMTRFNALFEIKPRRPSDVVEVEAGMSIATARAQPAGTVVTVVGVLTAGTGNFTDHSFYLQDGTAGIAVWRDAGSTAGSFSEGDSVRLTGTLGTYLQEVEISGAVTITLLGTTAVPAPVTVSSTQLNAGQRQGELLQVTGAIVDSVGTAPGTYRVYMHDGSGVLVLQVDTLALIPRSTFQVGATYTVTGLAGRANAVFHLQPRRTSDVAQTSAANPCTAWNSQSITFGQTRSGTLLATDCAPGDGFYYEGYKLTVSATSNITMTLTSAEFDAYLILTDTVGSDPSDTNNWLAADNDSGGGTNSQITGQIAAGTYIIWVSTNVTSQTGSFSLTVQ